MPKFRRTGLDGLRDNAHVSLAEHDALRHKLDQSHSKALSSLRSKKLQQAILTSIEKEEIHFFSEELANQFNSHLSKAKSAEQIIGLVSTYGVNLSVEQAKEIFIEYMRSAALERDKRFENIKSQTLRKFLKQHQQKMIDEQYQLPDFADNIDALNNQFEQLSSPKAVLSSLAQQGINLTADQGQSIFLEYRGAQDLKVYVDYKNLFMRFEQATNSPTLAKMACVDPTRWSPEKLRSLQSHLDRCRVPYVPKFVVSHFQRKVLATVVPGLQGNPLFSRILKESNAFSGASTSARLGQLTKGDSVARKQKTLLGKIVFKVLEGVGVQVQHRQRLHEVAEKRVTQAPQPEQQNEKQLNNNTHHQVTRMINTL